MKKKLSLKLSGMAGAALGTKIVIDYAAGLVQPEYMGWDVALSAAAIAAIGFYTEKTISRLLKKTKSALEDPAADQSDWANLSADQTEIGTLVETIKNLNDEKTEILSYIDEVTRILKQMGDGDFCIELRNSYAGPYAVLKTALESISENLTEKLEKIQSASRQVSFGADQVALGAQGLSQGSVEQASAIQELSAHMEEISSHIEKNAQKAEEANVLVTKVENSLLKSNSKMEDTAQAMDEITQKSNEIKNIIKAIDTIAFQTNILALNAAVEAARAGEAGKGFAVVADEVRNLAQKSADAAKNITELIGETILSVSRGDALSKETAEALSLVREQADGVARYISDINASTHEQAENVNEVTRGVEQISSVIQNNSATAEESAAASEELSGQSSTMNDLLGHFTFAH